MRRVFAMIGALPLVATVVGAVAAIIKLMLVRGRSGMPPATWYFALGITMLALALPLQLPPANLLPVAWPAQHILGLIPAYLMIAGFLHSVERDPLRTKRFLRPCLVALWVACAVMAGAFLLEPDASDWLFTPEGRYHSGAPGSPVAALGYIAFGSYFTVSVVALFVLSLRWARIARARGREGRWLARGLYVHAAGELPLFCYATHMAGYNVAVLLGVTPPWPEAAVDDLVKPIGASTVLLGLSIAALAALSWWPYERLRRAAHPLWTDVAGAMPHLAYGPLPTPRGLSFPRPDDARHAYRTVVELRDALILLSQLDGAKGVTTTGARGAAEIIAVHLPQWREGARPGLDPADPPVSEATTLSEELRWWGEVSRQIQTWPSSARSYTLNRK